ncbi:DUF763 domain-containing protein [Candidatus Bathyarchaeota archaeon]|nr:DUF763 domain-containing protein [Candidatus Bathyarchaeota archaeon]
MSKVGVADLTLHSGYAPAWLINRMIKLARSLLLIMVDEYGLNGILNRLSNPFFFQACSNVLGFDWDSSGSTTVTCGVLKQALKEVDLGLKVAGGKGKYSLLTPKEIDEIGCLLNLSSDETFKIKYASRMVAKIDNAAIQAGYQLYHHSIFISKEGDWTVIQQGMNPEFKAARRYHWFSSVIKSFIVEPHRGIISDKIHDKALNMTAKESEEARKISVELINEGVNRLKRIYASLTPQKPLTEFMFKLKDDLELSVYNAYSLKLKDFDWKIIEKAHQLEPQNYEELLAIQGVGPSTIRGLALISELVFGASPSWKDPAKYCFAFGGKDGVPFPIDKKAMDEAIKFLEEAVNKAKLGDKERYNALRKLAEWRMKLEYQSFNARL